MREFPSQLDGSELATTAVNLAHFDDELSGRRGGEGKVEFFNDIDVACF